jgi:hypothetical protein
MMNRRSALLHGAAAGALIASGLAILTVTAQPMLGVFDLVVGLACGGFWWHDHLRNAV